MVDPNRLAMAIDANIERMDCVNLATLLFHTGKKRLLLTPSFIKRIAARLNLLKEELRAREASNALYGLKCMSSECVGKYSILMKPHDCCSLSLSRTCFWTITFTFSTILTNISPSFKLSCL